MEKHKAAPDWRDEFHLLLDVRWNNRKQPLWPGQTPGDSKFLVRSLSLRDAIIDEVDGIPANATWYIPGIHIDDELDMGVRSGGSPLSLGSCVLHERGERMLEVVPDRRTKTTKQAYTKYRSGHWSLQLHHEAPRLAELSTTKLGMHSWCPSKSRKTAQTARASAFNRIYKSRFRAQRARTIPTTWRRTMRTAPR